MFVPISPCTFLSFHELPPDIFLCIFSDVTGIEMTNKKSDLVVSVWVKDMSESCGQFIGQVGHHVYYNILITEKLIWGELVDSPSCIIVSPKANRSILQAPIAKGKGCG